MLQFEFFNLYFAFLFVNFNHLIKTKTMKPKPVPEGYQSVIPIMIVDNPEKLIDFIVKVFDGQEMHRYSGPEGKIMHAEVRVGDSVIMLGSSSEKYPANQSMLNIYTEDTDQLYKKAIEAGATSIMEPTNQFYGDRSAGVKDSFGNTWWIATHIEDVSDEEMKKRSEEYMTQQNA